MSLRRLILSLTLGATYWFVALVVLSTVQRALGHSSLLTTPEVAAGLGLGIICAWLTMRTHRGGRPGTR